MKSAATRHPRLEVPDVVAQESDCWKFVGAVAIPTASVALFALAIGLAPRIALHHDPIFSIQPSAGVSPVFDIPREQLQIVSQGSLGREPTVAGSPTEPSPMAPFPVVPPFAVPTRLPPPVIVERDETPGRGRPAPLPDDRAESAPLELEAKEPDAGPGDPPRDMAAVPRFVPSTPEPPTPKPSAPEPFVQAELTAPPASPEPTLQAPLETRPGPQQPVSPEPKPPAEAEREPSTPEPSVQAEPTAPPASPEPTPQAPSETRPGPQQPVSPEPEPPLKVARQPPPAEAAPVPPPAGLQAPPAPRSGPPAIEPPQVATLPPGPAALIDQLLPPGRGSGHKLLAQLAATASTEGCDSRQLPFFRLIESNVFPARLAPGDRFSHRLVYALCPAGPDSRSTATVTRELRGSAEVVLTDKAEGFRLRPGTWASDEELAVPPIIDPGRYTVTTTVIFGGGVWTEQTDLLIE